MASGYTITSIRPLAIIEYFTQCYTVYYCITTHFNTYTLHESTCVVYYLTFIRTREKLRKACDKFARLGSINSIMLLLSS